MSSEEHPAVRGEWTRGKPAPRPPEYMQQLADAYSNVEYLASNGPLGLLNNGRLLREQLDAYDDVLVAAARKEGLSDADIARVVGIEHRQNLPRRFGPRGDR